MQPNAMNEKNKKKIDNLNAKKELTKTSNDEIVNPISYVCNRYFIKFSKSNGDLIYIPAMKQGHDGMPII